MLYSVQFYIFQTLKQLGTFLFMFARVCVCVCKAEDSSAAVVFFHCVDPSNQKV